MLESRHISSRKGLEDDQTSFRVFLKSASTVVEGQQLLLRAHSLQREWGSQGCGRCCKHLREPENATNHRELSEGWVIPHSLSTCLQTVTGMEPGSHTKITGELLLEACLYLVFLLLIFI